MGAHQEKEISITNIGQSIEWDGLSHRLIPTHRLVAVYWEPGPKRSTDPWVNERQNGQVLMLFAEDFHSPQTGAIGFWTPGCTDLMWGLCPAPV